MGGFFTFERKQVLCSTETEAVFADVPAVKRGQKRVEVLTHLDKKPDSELDIAALIAGTGRRKAKVALVLPLKDFQLVAVTAPPVAREAVAKVLPYSLAKVLNTSVTDHIYDWQVAQKFKDRHELTVYLYSAVRFLHLRNELEARKKEIAWFEPDVFAACSYLYNNRPGAEASTFLCLLAWGRSLSIAVYENHRITVVRSVEMNMPDGRPAFQSTASEAGNPRKNTGAGGVIKDKQVAGVRPEKSDLVDTFWLEGTDKTTTALARPQMEAESDPLSMEDSNTNDILAGFGLKADDPGESIPETPPVTEASPSSAAEPVTEVDRWQVYLENLNLEILRTGDYHVSVLKGSPIKEVFIGGAEHFQEALTAVIVHSGQTLQITRFPPEEIEAKCSQTLAAICIGALQR